MPPPDQLSDDPTFWPLHGSIERLIGYKRMNVALYGLTFDETWAYPEYDASNGAYLDGVCDWSDVTSDDEFPTCTSGEICSGHYEDDVLEFGNFLDEDEQYTNWEMYTFIHPWTEDLPYIYDTYDFDYCEEEDDLNESESVEDGKKVHPAWITRTPSKKALSRLQYHGKSLIQMPKAMKFKPQTNKSQNKEKVSLKGSTIQEKQKKSLKRIPRSGRYPGHVDRMINEWKKASTTPIAVASNSAAV